MDKDKENDNQKRQDLDKDDEIQFQHLLQSPLQNSLKNGYFNTAQQIVDDQVLDQNNIRQTAQFFQNKKESTEQFKVKNDVISKTSVKIAEFQGNNINDKKDFQSPVKINNLADQGKNRNFEFVQEDKSEKNADKEKSTLKDLLQQSESRKQQIIIQQIKNLEKFEEIIQNQQIQSSAMKKEKLNFFKIQDYQETQSQNKDLKIDKIETKLEDLVNPYQIPNSRIAEQNMKYQELPQTYRQDETEIQDQNRQILSTTNDEVFQNDEKFLKIKYFLNNEGSNLPKSNRMIDRLHYKKCLIYPENPYKGNWDLFISCALILSCFYTPLSLAFQKEKYENILRLVDFVVDSLFFIDIILTFNTCYYNDEVQLIDDRKIIAITYLKGWFTIDLVSCIPFNLLMGTSEYNFMNSIARAGRLFRVLKLVRFFRLFQVFKDRNRLMKQISSFFKIGQGFERLFYFILIFIFVIHFVSCMQILIASLQNSEYIGTWIEAHEYDHLNDSQIYFISVYWTITTISTVGYGDITPQTLIEKSFICPLMILGVVFYSYGNGTLASMISNFDQTNSEFKEKNNLLDQIYQQYCLPLDLYIKIKKSILYESQKDKNQLAKFVENLPHLLKVETSLYIYEERYMHIKFFKERSPSFISWICPQLKPAFYSEDQYIYMEGDEVEGIFFIVQGSAAFVLPSYLNTKYIDIKSGDQFGLIDIVGSAHTNEFKIDDFYRNKNKLERQFSVLACENMECQIMSLNTLHLMQQEFFEVYRKLFEDSVRILKRALLMKLQAMKQCSTQQNQHKLAIISGKDEEDYNQMSMQENQANKLPYWYTYNVKSIWLNKVADLSIESESFISERSDPENQNEIINQATKENDKEARIASGPTKQEQKMKSSLQRQKNINIHETDEQNQEQESGQNTKQQTFVNKEDLLQKNHKSQYDVDQIKNHSNIILQKLQSSIKKKFLKKNDQENSSKSAKDTNQDNFLKNSTDKQVDLRIREQSELFNVQIQDFTKIQEIKEEKKISQETDKMTSDLAALITQIQSRQDEIQRENQKHLIEQKQYFENLISQVISKIDQIKK